MAMEKGMGIKEYFYGCMADPFVAKKIDGSMVMNLNPVARIVLRVEGD